jgi:hypothetical protein
VVEAETPEAEAGRIAAARRWVALRRAQQLDRLHTEAQAPRPAPFDWWEFRSVCLATVGRLVRGEDPPVDRVEVALARHLARVPPPGGLA